MWNSLQDIRPQRQRQNELPVIHGHAFIDRIKNKRSNLRACISLILSFIRSWYSLGLAIDLSIWKSLSMGYEKSASNHIDDRHHAIGPIKVSVQYAALLYFFKNRQLDHWDNTTLSLYFLILILFIICFTEITMHTATRNYSSESRQTQSSMKNKVLLNEHCRSIRFRYAVVPP